MMTVKTSANRREFLKVSTMGLAAGAFIPGPRPVDPSVRVGLVGCGGRGTGCVRAMLEGRDRVELVAMGDIRQAAIDSKLAALREYKTRDKKPLPGVNVTPDKCFVGYDAYKRVIDSDIDVVLLITPPYARPSHFEYAVKAGKHVFIEKPCATDPDGIQRMLALESEVNRKGLIVVDGFERRRNPPDIECIQRIRDGQIGDVITAFAYYNTEDIWYREREQGMSDAEFWFHNWYHVDWMSGDHIVEQHVHDLDVINWVFDELPAKAYGMGGRQFHTDRGGNIYDHFAVEYEYPSGRRMTSMCRQIQGTDGRTGEHIIGTKGQALLSFNEGAQIIGASPWASEAKGAGHQFEANDIVDSVRENRRTNKLRHVCESTMTAIMGREAAYTGKVITWDAIMKSRLKLVPDDLATWDGRLSPVFKPGMPRAL